MKLSLTARQKLKDLEGFREYAYIPVKGDVWTVGYGFTKGVQKGDYMTLEQADARLVSELSEYEHAVYYACTTRPNQNQFDAMVLLCYNIGIAGFKRSSVLKAHNRGDHQAAARAFALWNKSGGKVYTGLTRRRAYEAALYLKPVPESCNVQRAEEAMPQTVDEESTMPQSTINRAGFAAGGTATVATVAEVARTVSDTKQSVQSLGDWLVPALLVLVVAICGYIIYERIKQRKQGWA